ncbi:MAG: hypothetical protein E5W82_09080 [Mesorhizobium sp.]|nr:MAG: hypothetical protein E5W82_09080 [Mesorhizobium sp.]
MTEQSVRAAVSIDGRNSPRSGRHCGLLLCPAAGYHYVRASCDEHLHSRSSMRVQKRNLLDHFVGEAHFAEVLGRQLPEIQKPPDETDVFCRALRSIILSRRCR